MSTRQMVAAGSRTVSKTKTSISVEQSQKLIQTMLTMSFGCLAFLRGLFPDDSFVDQRFVPEKVEKDYKKQEGVSGNSIKIKTLVRGKSNEIDLLLNWLEKGVFQSIKLKYLKALSLGIFLDENDPTDLLENYIFSFNYDNEDSFDMQVGSENRPDGQTPSISLLDSRKMAQQLMRRFIIITQSLEPLPQRKFLTLRLMFNDSAPPDYQPHLFKDATFEKAATVKIPLTTDPNTTSVGSLNTNHHKIALKVLSAADCETALENGRQPDIISVDPFDLVDDKLPEAKFSQDFITSQTTNILGDILKSSQASIQPTQAVNYINEDEITCECGVNCPVESTSLKTCRTCRKKVHGICYGNSRNSTIDRCMLCVYGPSLDVEGDHFKDLMLLRKIYRFIARARSIPASIKLLTEQLFGSFYHLDKETERRVAFCLSILFQDGILSVDGDKRQHSNSQSSRSSSSVLVDIAGINAPDRGLLKENIIYSLRFAYNSSNMHSCFTDVIGESKYQIQGWLTQIKDLRNLHISSTATSFNFASLELNDSGPSEMNEQTKKRKSHDLHQYLNSEQDSSSMHMETLETQNPKKIRKISVSKKSLRSAW